MNMIDIVLLLLYSLAIACSWYIIHCHREYFYERFQKGVVSVFMLAMLIFLLAYTFKMLIVLLVQVAVLLGADITELLSWLQYAWIFAQLGTTAGLLALAALTRSGTYDQFLHIKKVHRKEERHHADTDSGEK
ncbi:hypothetical protein [Paenibacillus agri]|uniref:Uncharacterized protein n=1 Tax=Paenibacillus agri TaxID=2744309 RepID=A0A850EP10_9BACL|nr:hypothetical protein [Paenibacillus agri]NUU61277.1 hypothetical protein [Paenibacillus agri]